MNQDQEDRMLDMLGELALSFGRIADALEGLNGTATKAGNKFWPEHKTPREPIITRTPTEEDKVREAQGQDTGKSLDEWLEIPPGEREFVGFHERAFLEREAAKRDAGPQAVSGDGSEGGRPAQTEGEAGGTGDSPANHPVSEASQGGTPSGTLSDEDVRRGRSYRGIPSEI